MAATDFNEASVDIQVRRLTRLARAHADYVEACAEIERTAADELAQAATAYVLGDGNATGNGEDSPPLSETAA